MHASDRRKKSVLYERFRFLSIEFDSFVFNSVTHGSQTTKEIIGPFAIVLPNIFAELYLCD